MNNRNRIAAAAGALVVSFAVVVGCANIGQNQTNRMPATPETIQQNPETAANYPVHDHIIATEFHIGENESSDNGYIHNRSTVWVTDAVGAYGGIDDPDNRCGYVPCAFRPLENSFYVALPVSDYDENGPKSVAELSVVPWYDGKPLADGESILKNRWVKISYGGRTAYAQWEDAGPFGEDDTNYVFGTAEPKYADAGIDLSPAVMDYLRGDGQMQVSWQFVAAEEVPDGDWKKTVTTSPPQFE